MATMASSTTVPLTQSEPASESLKKDPLYAAMLGGHIGSNNGGSTAVGGSGSRLDSSVSGLDTLDEPVFETLRRDLNNIGEKLKMILLMKSPPSESVHDWELWGPLLMCLGLAVSLGVSSSQNVFIFTLVFMLVWLGSLAVTANARLLGYRISFFQTVCLLGYGLFPLMVASFMNMLLPLVWILKLALTGCGLAWSVMATIQTMDDQSLEDRKLLAVYPVALYYFLFAWMIIVV